MAYQALYREWRSQTFDEMVGQETITQTLKNAITQNKISHAYLFTGPRGTGKTSAAKVFSKAINCKQAINGEPCNQCEDCIGITQGRVSDVIEIDAASNNGVEEIRDIREKVKYAPTQVTNKVYIIDEVHMLSTGAFNALLKTLEEPPKHVVFILATTEPHKIPATIISRTQRFDFKPISQADIASHLETILTNMEITYETDAVKVIARAAEGGMRDALSILDQALSYRENVLDMAVSLEVTGSLTSEMMDNYLMSCINLETEKALTYLNQLILEGKESNRIVENLLMYCRDLLIFQKAPALFEKQVGRMTDGFKQLSETVSENQLYQLINLLNETQKEIKFSHQPSVFLEVMTIKLSTSEEKKANDLPVSSFQNSEATTNILKKLNELENELHTLKQQQMVTNGSYSSSKEKTNKQKKTVTYRVPTEQVYGTLDHATKTQLAAVKDAWIELLQLLSVTQRAMIKASEPVAASGDKLIIAFEYEILCQKANQDEELNQAIKQGLNQLLQYSPDLISIPLEQWQEIRKSFISNRSRKENQETEKKEEKEAIVDDAKELFGSLVKVIED